MIYMAGLDLGQAQDPTALIVMEVEATEIRYPPEAGIYGHRLETLPIKRMDIRHIESYQLRTRYSDIVKDVTGKMSNLPGSYLAVDKTGVGAGVVEMFGWLNPISITITGGNQATVGVGPQEFHVPKRELIAGVQVALQNGVLRIAKGLQSAVLLQRELENFRGKFTAVGHETFEAWREGDHDDLVLGTAIACWAARLVIEIAAKRAIDDINRPPPYRIGSI